MIAHADYLLQKKGARPERTAKHLFSERSEEIVKKIKNQCCSASNIAIGALRDRR
jgi:hypothetical protein